MKNGKFLKVLQVLGNSKYGGGTYLILEITKKLIKEGYQVSVNTSDPITISKFKKLGVNIIKIKEMRRNINLVLDLIALIKLFFIIKKENFHIVHTHSSKGRFIGNIAAKLAGVPIIIDHCHNYYFHNFKGFIRKVFIILEKICSKFSDANIFIERENMQSALNEKIVKNENIILITPGIDLKRFKNVNDSYLLRKKEGFFNDEIIITFIGRLHRLKGPDIFIEAAALINEKFPNLKCKFILIGEGPLRDSLVKQIINLKLTNKIKLLGFRSDIIELLNITDLYIFPSRWEGLPIGLLEAMAAEKPIVATNIKGNREVIEHKKTGLLIPPDNPYELANAIIYLIQNKEKALKMAHEAKKTIIEKFSIKRMTGEILKLYVDLTEEKILDN